MYPRCVRLGPCCVSYRDSFVPGKREREKCILAVCALVLAVSAIGTIEIEFWDVILPGEYLRREERESWILEATLITPLPGRAIA
jgi:hypothetical protein